MVDRRYGGAFSPAMMPMAGPLSMAPIAQSGNLQPGPVEIGPAPPLEPAGMIPGFQAVQNDPEPQPQAPPEINPEVQTKAKETLAESTRRAKELDDETTEKLGGAIMKNMDEDSLVEEFKAMVEAMGGGKEINMDLTPKEKAIAVLDFGMRMMAASNDPNAQLGGVIGTAGSGALQGVLGRQQAKRESAMEREKDIRDSALSAVTDMQKARMQGAKTEFIQGPDGKTYAAAVNPRTGTLEYYRDPEGNLVQPGAQPARSSGPTDYQRRFNALMQALPGTEDERRKQATFILEGAKTPAEERQRWNEIIADWKKNRDKVTPPGGLERIDVNNWTEAQIKDYIDSQVRRSWDQEFSWAIPGE